MVPLEGLDENHCLLTSSSFWWLWEMLGFYDLWHHSNLNFHLYIPLLLCMSQISLCLSLTKTHVIGFRAHLDNPGKSHLRLANVMMSAKTLFPNYQKNSPNYVHMDSQILGHPYGRNLESSSSTQYRGLL